MAKRETMEDLRRKLREAEDRATRAEAERDAYLRALGMATKVSWPQPVQPIDLTPRPIWIAPEPERDGPIWIDPTFLPPSWWGAPKVDWAPRITCTGSTVQIPGES